MVLSLFVFFCGRSTGGEFGGGTPLLVHVAFWLGIRDPYYSHASGNGPVLIENTPRQIPEDECKETSLWYFIIHHSILVFFVFFAQESIESMLGASSACWKCIYIVSPARKRPGFCLLESRSFIAGVDRTMELVPSGIPILLHGQHKTIRDPPSLYCVISFFCRHSLTTTYRVARFTTTLSSMLYFIFCGTLLHCWNTLLYSGVIRWMKEE